MKIEIKKTHIQCGRQNDRFCCPIALATKAALSATRVEVNQTTMKIGHKKIRLPDIAMNFVRAFDSRKSSVRPFTLEI